MALKTSLVVLSALLGAAPPQAMAADLIVYHGWSAPAELAALNVLKGEVEAQGHRWISLGVPQASAGGIDVLDLIGAGTPPNLFLEPSSDIYRQLDAEDRLLHLDDQFAGILDKLPDVVLQAITVDGHIVKVPATIHADAMIYFNRAVATAAGVDPAGWRSLEDMWADFPRIEAAGYKPLAIGAQPWQVGYLFHSLVAALGGSALYGRLYAETPDASAFADPSLVEAFAWLRRFQQASGPEATQIPWNTATNQVIAGSALMQVQGDWMKGEWHAAGKTGADYGCIDLPGASALPVTVDSWGLLGGVAPDVEAAERAFADTVVDAGVQVSFARAKGSTPIRPDARGAIDDCSRLVLALIEQPGYGVLTPHLSTKPAWVTAIWDVTTRFWTTPSMTPPEAIAVLHAAAAELSTIP